METQAIDQFVARLGNGDRHVPNSLMGLFNGELHRMARFVLQSEAPDSRTRPSSLVN